MCQPDNMYLLYIIFFTSSIIYSFTTFPFTTSAGDAFLPI